MKYDERACHFNMDTGCVELLLRDGRMISIDCTGVAVSSVHFSVYRIPHNAKKRTEVSVLFFEKYRYFMRLKVNFALSDRSVAAGCAR